MSAFQRNTFQMFKHFMFLEIKQSVSSISAVGSNGNREKGLYYFIPGLETDRTAIHAECYQQTSLQKDWQRKQNQGIIPLWLH